MPEEILINVTPGEVRIAVMQQGALQDIFIERNFHKGLTGNFYQGRVIRLLPGIQAAFIDIGLNRPAFLHISDISMPPNRNADSHATIETVLHPGQSLLVQVYKEPLENKGARVTTQFTLPSRYLVLTPGLFQIAASQRLSDEQERQRLINLLTPGKWGGYIARTVAHYATMEEIEADKIFLDQLWQEITERAAQTKPGKKVYEDIPLGLRILRDVATYEVEKIAVDDVAVLKQMQHFANQYVPQLEDKLEYYQENLPIFDNYAIETALQNAVRRTVYLKSGAYLVFDQNEAMTTIDINTGSNQQRNHDIDIIFHTNLEAVDVIAEQVRLRNLGGIIIIDFIDMPDQLHKEKLLEALSQALAKDRVRTEISELSRLGLVQMTRKRSRESLIHLLCSRCPRCQGEGKVKSIETITYEIFREIQRISSIYTEDVLQLIAAPIVVNCLLQQQSFMLDELASRVGKKIQLQGEALFLPEQFEIKGIKRADFLAKSN